MAYAPIAFTLPQYEDYPNWWMKAYEQGTTTPLSIATDSTGGTTAAKIELNVDGFPVTAGAVRFIPFINGDYDLWLFPTAAEADANDTTNAIQLADNVNADPKAGSSVAVDKRHGVVLPTIASLTSATPADLAGNSVTLSEGMIVHTAGYRDGWAGMAEPQGGGSYDIQSLATVRTAKADPAWVPDEYGDHTLNNGLVAVLRDYKGDILQYGVSTSEVDNADAMQAALDAYSEFVVPATPSGIQFTIKSTLYPNSGQRIYGTGLIKASSDWTADNWILNFGAEQIKAQHIFQCNGVEDVEIVDVQVDVSDLPSLASHSRKTIVFFHYEVGVYKEHFRARGVRSNGAGIAAYCNVSDVLVEDCEITNDAVSPLISFETIYPNSGAAPYQYPIGCKAINNTLDNPISVENIALVWLSGAKDILLRGNKISGRGDLIQIYVNDLKVGMENCHIDDNDLHQYATTINDRSPINVMGKSFIDPGGSHTFEMSDVEISRNRFTTDTDYSAQTTSKPSVISAIFAGNIKVWGNKATNYYYGFSFTDHFSTTYVRRSTPEIYDNELTELADKPVRWIDTLESTSIRGNFFKNWGKQLTTFATRTCLDLTRIRNVYVTGNKFASDDSVTRERIYDLDQCVNCVIGDNDYSSNHNALFAASTLDSSGYLLDNTVESISGQRKRYMSVGRNPLGVFKVGDVNDYSFSPFVSGPNSYVQQVCTTAGTTPGGAYTETATGTATNNFFTASSLSGLLRVNQGVTIDGNAYTITDVDYFDNKFYVTPVLATTFAAAAITATSGVVWKDTSYFV